jgi:hypothetical protein
MNNIEKINKLHNTEYTNNLLKNRHIFLEIFAACNFKFLEGCGSYLFDGKKYMYCDLMYSKQELLYNSVKNAKNVLEIGTYMGHSLLIMLMSNPNLKITCIDISDEYTLPAVTVLNKYFNNAITFIHSDSLNALKILNQEPNIKFDFFHIDGLHENNYISQEFELIKKLNNNDNNILKVIFDDQDCLIQFQKNISENYTVIKHILPKCIWNNVYFEILI